MLRRNSFLLIAVVLCLGFALLYSIDAGAQADAVPFDSPLPLPTALPTPAPLSPEAEVAFQYIATHEGIKREWLVFARQETVEFPTLGRKFANVNVFSDSAEDPRSFSILVDMATLTVEPDYNAIRMAEDAAYVAKYGNLNPGLYERLQKIGDEEMLPVAIWIAPSQAERTEEDIQAEVIARFPAAREALTQKGVLWAVSDPDLAAKIQGTYEQLVAERASKRVQPLLTSLKEQGFAVSESTGMPVLTVSLPKRAIVALSKRSDVAEIFLIEGQAMPAVESAMPSDRAPEVWAKGITGTGARIGILEQYRINTTAANCLSIVDTRPLTSTSTSDHKSGVAAIAACNHATLRGMAYGAQVVDAGHNGGQLDIVEALKWATDPTAAARTTQVVNESESIQIIDGTLQYTDRAYDYWVKQRGFTAVIAAGNAGALQGYVTSPAKGYNVIAVGNVDDHNTSSWADDSMAGNSSYIDPVSGVGKPEVAATGENINTVIAGIGGGTSYAAPQVAGLAALLMQRDPDLKNWPTAVKAIIMASAVHNVEGASTLSDYDGAGSIDAVLADAIAQTEGNTGTCSTSCWWNVATSDANPALNGYIERTFTANRGENIRVAIAWLSQADAPTGIIGFLAPDRLFRNFKLEVFKPSNFLAASSDSSTNNYEIVDFTAPETGQYRIRITRQSTSDLGNEPGGNLLGIAWSKQATYLPEMVHNLDNWTTSIMVRNESPQSRPLRVTFYHIAHAGGGFAFEYSTTLTAGQEWEFAPPSALHGSAIVNGSEDLAVSTAVRRNPVPNNVGAAYAGVSALRTADVIYVPMVMRQRTTASGTGNSDLYIQNTGSSLGGVAIDLIAQPGSGYSNYTTPSINILPGVTQLYSLQNESAVNVPDNWIGSAVVRKTYGAGGITVLSDLKFGAATIQSVQGFSFFQAVDTWHIPLFTSRLVNGLSTPVTFQNLGGGYVPTNTIKLECTPTPNTTGSPFTVWNDQALSANGYYAFNPVVDARFPNDWHGSCKLASTQGAIGVTFVQMRYVGTGNTANAAAYEAMPKNTTARQIVFPLIQKRLSNGAATTVSIRNLGPGATNLTFYYYGACSGCADYVLTANNLAADTAIHHNHRLSDLGIGNYTIPDSWYGSLVVTSSSRPIDGFSQLTNLNMHTWPGDLFLAYKGITP